MARRIAAAVEGCDPVSCVPHIYFQRSLSYSLGEKNTRAYYRGSKVQHDQQPGDIERDTHR